jgi:hypothetical protein
MKQAEQAACEGSPRGVRLRQLEVEKLENAGCAGALRLGGDWSCPRTWSLAVVVMAVSLLKGDCLVRCAIKS